MQYPPAPWYEVPAFPLKEKKAIIIGAGVAGCFAAYSMACRGFKVVLMERGETIANGASGNPTGIIMPLIAHEDNRLAAFYWECYQYSLALLDVWGKVAGWDPCGVIECDPGKVQRAQKPSVVPGAFFTKLPKEDTIKKSGIALPWDGLFFSKAGMISPQAWCQAAISSYPEHIVLKTSTGAIALCAEGSVWEVVSDKGEREKAPVVIIANAMDAKQFVQCQWLPMEIIRGQLTFVPSSILSSRLRTVLCYGGYITPPDGRGQHIAGATYRRNTNSTMVTEEEHEENLHRWETPLGLGNYAGPLEGKVAFRAATSDKQPLAGPLPDRDAYKDLFKSMVKGHAARRAISPPYINGLYVTLAHGSRGLMSAPFVAEILAKMITGEVCAQKEKWKAFLHPGRYIIRQLQMS